MITDRAIRNFSVGVAVGGLLAAATMFLAGPAKADGMLDPAETDYVATFGEGAICGTIAETPSVGGVFGVVAGVMAHTGWDGGSAVDVVNTSVMMYCPEYWPILAAAGETARNRGAVA